MPFLTKGKTNWKYILIVVILAVIVGGGILGYLKYFKREISYLSKFPEIKKPEKKGVSITTDKIEYKQGENVTIILDTGGKEIYLQKNVFTGKILISKEYEVYKLQGTDWVKLRINTYCGNVMVCGESGPLLPACPVPPQPECNKITNRITWVWDQKTWEYVEKTCANIPYTNEELKQVEPGMYKIRVTYYDSSSCTGTPKYLETQFKITNETANWKTYRNDEYGFEFKYPAEFKFDVKASPEFLVYSPGAAGYLSQEAVKRSIERHWTREKKFNNALFILYYDYCYGGAGSYSRIINAVSHNSSKNYYVNIWIELDGLGGVPQTREFWVDPTWQESYRLTEKGEEWVIQKMMNEEDEEIKIFNQMLSTFRFLE